MNSALQEIYARIERETKSGLECGRPFAIAINGMDCSGKTCFARGLTAYLQNNAYAVTLIHIDDFNNLPVQREIYEELALGRLTPQHRDRFYEGSIDHARAARAVLPQLEAGHGSDVVIVEGVLLHKVLRRGFTYAIYLEVAPAVAESRYRQRRQEVGDTRSEAAFRDLWLPVHERYVREYAPRTHANLIIDNNDYELPRLLSHTE